MNNAIQNSPLGCAAEDRAMRDEKETVDYWIRAASGGGRLRERVRIRCKLALWKLVLVFSYGLKRVLDVCAASAALIGGSPVFGITALLIKLEDGGPVSFANKGWVIGESFRNV